MTHESPPDGPSFVPYTLRGREPIEHDNEIESAAVFDDTETAVRAFTAAGPTDSPSSTPVSPTVARAVRDALTAFPAHARIVLPARYESSWPTADVGSVNRLDLAHVRLAE